MEKYAIDKVIGEGTYGIVYKATEKGTGDVVAIKKFKSVGGTTDTVFGPKASFVLEPETKRGRFADEQLSKREIQACSMLSHPYIVSYRHSFRHEGLLHLVFDFVPNSLNKVLARNRRGIKPVQAQRLIYQLCQALQYCHANRIIHRDVKPDNILLDEKGDIRLCDFGVARTIQFEGDPLSDYVATRWYRPPEQELRMDRYSFDADMWSVGCVLMELLTGRPLFPGSTQIDQINLIQDVLGPLPTAMLARLPRGISATTGCKPTRTFADLLGDRSLPEGTLDFLARTIQLEPRQRLSATECLSHPFLRGLRDAELRARKHRQLEEKERGGGHDDGIEEEIPGCSRAEAKDSPVSTPTPTGRVGGPRSMDFKGIKSTEGAATPPRTRVARRLAACKQNGDNNDGGCDSDDIQEIIEMDEISLAEPVSPRPGKRTSSAGHARGKGGSGAGGGGRRRRLDGEALRDPVEHECYEDDFEEYQQ